MAGNILQKDTSAKLRTYISKLSLNNFRNYESLSIRLSDKPVVITGCNGAGKTNILESISFLSPGRGLRSVKLDQMDRHNVESGLSYPWAVNFDTNYGYEQYNIGIARDIRSESNKRLNKIDGEPIKSQAELSKYISVLWLTPQMDGLFVGPSSDRRRFLDRLIYNFDPEHASRVYSYEYNMRERSKLLQQDRCDPGWLSVLESKMAEKSVSIAAARIETIKIIQQFIMQAPTVFPKAILGVDGEVEKIVYDQNAMQAEEEIKQQFAQNRTTDKFAKKTTFGPHRSDFVVCHDTKSRSADSCSTGEQKALLMSIILAEARAKMNWKESAPIILLDEVVAHFDDKRREYLFDEILAMNAQIWMTGTDSERFAKIKNDAVFLEINDGEIT